MASIRRAFTDEFKAEAVRLVTVEGHPARQVAKDLGIHESLLRRWQRKLEARQARAPGVKPSATVAASIMVEQEEIRKLKRENERLRMERDGLEKSHRHLLGDAEVTFQFIQGHCEHFPVRLMCQVLDVSRSGFYDWLRRPESPRAAEDRALVEKIQAIHNESGRTYGSPRVHASLKAEGYRIGRKRVARLMRENDIRAKTKRKSRSPTS